MDLSGSITPIFLVTIQRDHTCSQLSEVKTISANMRTIYESMTENRAALKLLSIGIVQGISTVVQPPCEDPSPF
jgi:hypothetical protein